jgi:hypothetical protein
VAPPPVHESWAIAVHAGLAGMPAVLVCQLVPLDAAYELVVTTRESPPGVELVDAVAARLGRLVERDDSPVSGWHFYPAVDSSSRALFARLDWADAVVLHEFVD